MARLPRIFTTAARSVIRVGEGRGFVVNGSMIITAAHCLPNLPTGFGIGDVEERTYRKLLARLGFKGKTFITAECLFVDPVADIAVLGPPDYQVFFDENDYDTLVESIEPLAVSAVITNKAAEQRAWMLSLAGDWFACKVKHHGGPWWPTDCAQHIEGGMSGSPILDDTGAAIGVVAASSNIEPLSHSPRLCWQLPTGLLSVMEAKE